jgi:hypothetical protein
MKIERCFRIDSISTLVLGLFLASIASGQESDGYLFRPIATDNSSYYQEQKLKEQTLKVQSEKPGSEESTRRREISRQSLNAFRTSDLLAGRANPPQQRSSKTSGTRTKQESNVTYFNEAQRQSSPQPGIVQTAGSQDSESSSQVTPAGFAILEEKKQEPEGLDKNGLEDMAPRESYQPNLDSQDSERNDDPGDPKPQLQEIEMNPKWFRKKIQEVRTDVRDMSAVAPVDRSSELDYGMTDWSQFSCAPKVFAWAAPDIRYQPLYFEDVALERYGQTLGFHRQTFRSGYHFFMSSITFPNKLRHDPPKSCDYPLGFCRPGDCVPAIKQKHYLGHPHR